MKSLRAQLILVLVPVLLSLAVGDMVTSCLVENDSCPAIQEDDTMVLKSQRSHSGLPESEEERLTPLKSGRVAHDHKIKITMGEKELGASQRFLAESLSTEAQCKRLVEITKSEAMLGDGYGGDPSPNTEFEDFKGLGVEGLTELLKSDSISASDVKLMLDVSENCRQLIVSTFNLTSELYFDYTHLVCRSVRPVSEVADPRSNDDLSHRIHADNCMPNDQGECVKDKPALGWRDYSAILYLNDDFEGGQFFFTQPEELELDPHCGLLVAFSSGHENMHGVRGVTKGHRCALAMWYTLDLKYKEVQRDDALKAVFEKLEQEKNDRNSRYVHNDL